MSEKNKNSDAYLRLPPKRQRFVDEYVIDFNGTQAAIRAGYSKKTADRQAEQLLRILEVKQAVEAKAAKIAERNKVKADDVLQELRRLGFSDITNILTWKNNTITLRNASKLQPEVTACISEISQTGTANGRNIKIKLHSKTTALEMLGRYLALFTDKHEVTGKGGEPIKISYDYSRLSAEELRQLLALTDKVVKKK